MSMRRMDLALESAICLFLACVVVSIFYLFHQGHNELKVYVTVLAIPAIASVLFTLVSGFVPDIFAQNAIKFPLNITLPIVYASLILVTLSFATVTEASIAKSSEALQPAFIWGQPKFLIVSILAQIGALSVITVLRNDSKIQKH